MKVLHILKKEPDDTVKKLIEYFSGEDAVTLVALYQDELDWFRLVDDIFSHEKVICWW